MFMLMIPSSSHVRLYYGVRNRIKQETYRMDTNISGSVFLFVLDLEQCSLERRQLEKEANSVFIQFYLLIHFCF